MSRIESIFRPVPRTGVIYVMTEAAKRGFRYGHPEWDNLGQGAPETGNLPDGTTRLRNIAVDDVTSEYGPVAGVDQLREAVAELYNQRYRRGRASRYTAENVAIAAGGRAALTRVAAALGPVNLGHLLPDYTAYEELLEIFRAFVAIPVPLPRDNGFRLTPEHLESVSVGLGLGAVLLSNPCNPTGQLLAGAELEQIVSGCRDRGCALLVDEFYSHYVYSDEIGKSVSATEFVEDVDRDPVVILDGLTKNWRYPGLRLSWTVGPREVIERVASAGSFLDGGATHAAQMAALPLVDEKIARSEAAVIQVEFSKKRAWMVQQLRAMRVVIEHEPQGAFYCFGSLENLPRELRDGMDFFRAALEERVICVPGEFFDVNPGKRRSHIPSRLKSYVRFSYGPDFRSVERGLERLAALVQRHA